MASESAAYQAAAAPPRRVTPRHLSPQSFGDAKTLADEFKAEVPVIMNLQGTERELSRRLIDFASGLCYALEGSMEKLAPQIFLLTPPTVTVSDEDRRRFERPARQNR
ncbi:MAG: cell division protein SepF [Acidimicrobiia bacterium]|nr:cell division protein SepF [Acidimicrobiia bacterium]